MTVKIVKLHYWFINRLPRWIIYWCAMRLWVASTTGKYGTTIAPKLTLDEAIRRWEID